MKSARTLRSAVAMVVALGVAVAGFLTPSSAATRSTVVIVSSNVFSSLNPSTQETNITINGDVAYLSGSGFIYYDNNRNLVENKVFGSFKIVKNTAKDFRVQYTVAPGRVWSDGTPITGVDLLLSHVLSSSDYSKRARLGDPASTENPPAFDSIGYGGTYDENVVGDPVLSKDQMSVTIRYKAPLADWKVLGPGPSPVHALVHMVEGKKALQAAAANTAAKAKFATWFQKRDTANLKKMGAIWSTDYHIKTVNSSTNPLLLVGNGGFIVRSAVADQSITLAANPRYNSGPKLSGGIKTVVFRFIGDGTAAAQALANKEIDIYQGQPTADAVAQLKALPGVRVIGGVNACYEHIDLRVGGFPDSEDEYTGPFANSNNAIRNARAKDLRTAFLLAFPRQQIVDTLVKPINSKAVVVNSVFTLPGEAAYNTIVKTSGVSKYSAGTQDQRTAQALALVKKHFPNASATNPGFKVRLLWGTPSNQRRASMAQLIIAAAAKAGIEVEAPGAADWGGRLSTDNSYDAQFFAWCPTSVSQTGTNANFQTGGGNNWLGFSNPEMDRILTSLQKPMSQAQVTKAYAAAEKILINEALSLAIFQHPAATAHNATLKNVKPSPLSPNLVWNYWEWRY